MNFRVENLCKALYYNVKYLGHAAPSPDPQKPTGNGHLKWVVGVILKQELPGFTDERYQLGLVVGACIAKGMITQAKVEELMETRYRKTLEKVLGHCSYLDEVMQESNYYRPKDEKLIKICRRRFWQERRG